MNISNYSALERERIESELIAAAQDVRSKADLFTTADKFNYNDKMWTWGEQEHAEATPESGRYQDQDPVLPEFPARTAYLRDFAALRLESTFSDMLSPIDKMVASSKQLLYGLALRRDIQYVAAAKGNVDIKVDMPNSEDPSIQRISAAEDGVIIVDALGGTSSSGRPLAITVEDFLTTTQIHAERNTGNPEGLAGGTDGQALKGRTFVMWTSPDRSDLLIDDVGGRIFGNSDYYSIIKNAEGTSANTNSLDIVSGYPCVICGTIDKNSPINILDSAGDSIIIDNGDGTYDVERDILFSTSEAVVRAMSPIKSGMMPNPTKPSVINISLNFLLGGLRTRGESLVFLKTQRTVGSFFAANSLLAGYNLGRRKVGFRIVNGKEHAIEKLERIESKGPILSTMETPLLKKLKKLADGQSFETKTPSVRNKEAIAARDKSKNTNSNTNSKNK